MNDIDGARRTAQYWGRSELARTVLDALGAAGKDLDNLNVDELAATDQFHGGGRPATLRLAELAGLVERGGPAEPAEGEAGLRVLDVGGGLGGPARTLASRFGCRVTVIDLTESYVDAARVLTDKVGYGHLVDHEVGNALDLPFEDGCFDMVWTQNSGMNIADKAALYSGFHRVLRPGGTLALQEPMAGRLSPPHFPVMWADDESMSFLRPPEEMRALIIATGFDERHWEAITETASSATAPAPPPHAVQRLIMGDERLAAIQQASKRNLAEGRLTMVHAVFTRR